MSSQQLAELLTSSEVSTRSSTSFAWNEIVESAVNERVAAVLAHVVRDDAAIPPAARQVLTRELYHTGASNLLLYRELARMLATNAELSGSSPPIVLKGAALASTVYDDIAHRPMSDIDLLVRKNDVDAWKRTLDHLGYVPVAPEMSRGIAETVHYQLAFRGGPHRDVVVELHWNLVAGDADWRAPEIEWFWEQAEPWPGIDELGCPAALQLNPLANVLYLSAHAILQHGGARTRLVWLYDIHRVIAKRADTLDWNALVDRARALHWDAALSLALERARAFFGTAVPERVLGELSRDVTARTKTHVDAKAKVESSRAELVWRELACLDTLGRFRLARAIVFPAPAYMKWRYAKAGALWPLSYLYRPVVIAAEAVAHGLRVLTTALSFVSL